MATTRARLSVPSPFDLRTALFGHGWVGLAPHAWCPDTATFTTAVAHPRLADLRLRATPSGLSLRIDTARPLSASGRRELVAAVRSMLRLDEDLRPFWRMCSKHAHLRWVGRRGAGRILRSAHLFEDLMKLLFTTNCSWAATEKMTARLVEALGPKAPSGRRAFPTARACASVDQDFYRTEVRTGYRARSCHALAIAFASGDLVESRFADPELETDTLRERLIALPGFGPYAAGQAMRLLGRHDDLALDSWCRNRIAELQGKSAAPSDRSIERRYAEFGRYKGLAMWMELTAAWHGES